MKAYRYDCETFKLGVADVPIPTPGAGQALIRVEAAGLCHSDTNLLKGVVRLPHKQPITLGHEVAGTVIQLGPQRVPDHTSANTATPQPLSFKPGDRVAVAQVAHPLSPLNWVASIGLGHDGGYAPYTLAYVDRLVPIPPGVSFAQAASATDAISTAYHAMVTTGAVGPGMTVGVIGLGGLGMNGLQVAALRGATVYGVDVNVVKFGEARAKGAAACAASIKELKDVVFDIVVDFVGMTVTTRSAIDAVREGGTVVLVGLGESSVRIPSARMVSKGVALLGSIGASLEDLREVLCLIEDGKLKPTLTEVPFGEVEAALWSLDRNEVAGRLYTCPGKESSVLKSNL
ncbi:NAD-dependent alcohol dehydrogenase [Lasiodiplodia theobromae]|uniref:NAD-dependent alcohol dehydrogenase n=1 Tax=Lasiodiplodia theobromae TaxID=45133 RepID=A0A5N5CXC7_9PEZI|nr:NAD-dependent alcohol dehydrogenase [Lasiodiplodia theobromae]